MNTLLPHSDFKMCGKLLDDRRLARCVQDAATLLNAVAGKHIPSWMRKTKDRKLATLWTPHLANFQYVHLARYVRDLNDVYYERTRRNLEYVSKVSWVPMWTPDEGYLVWPERLHEIHRNSLLSKDWGYYAPLFEEAGLSVSPPHIAYEYPAPLLVGRIQNAPDTGRNYT